LHFWRRRSKIKSNVRGGEKKRERNEQHSVNRSVDYVKVVDALADVVKELNRGAEGTDFADPACAAAHAAAEYGATADQGLGTVALSASANAAHAKTKVPVYQGGTVFVTAYNMGNAAASLGSTSIILKSEDCSTQEKFTDATKAKVLDFISKYRKHVKANNLDNAALGTQFDKAVKDCYPRVPAFPACKQYQFAYVPDLKNGSVVYSLYLNWVEPNDNGRKMWEDHHNKAKTKF
jgi:hypothetical protein